jgi:hypothetical protein
MEETVHRSILSHAAVPAAARGRRAALAVLAAVASSAPASAQDEPPRFFVSTTADVAASAGIPAISDGDVILLQENEAPLFVRTRGHWRAAAGLDLGDVDGLGRRPGFAPGAAGSVAFSLLSNVGGFLDGDVLALTEGGGVEVVVSEDVLTAGLGVAAGSIDVDALGWDGQGRLYVSLQSDVAGTAIGDVQNGDVLRLDPDGTLKRVLTEMDIEEKLALATGSTASVGDVHGLDIVGGEAIVTIQSPSEFDGAVLDCGQEPKLLLTEAGAGLGGEELDALMLVGDDDVLPLIRFDVEEAPSGATLHAMFQGDDGGALLVLWSGGAGYVPFFGVGFGGFGGWYVDPADPWLNSIFTGKTLPLVPLDGTGAYEIDYTLPLGVSGVGLDGKPGWTFQVMDLDSLETSAPYRVELF